MLKAGWDWIITTNTKKAQYDISGNYSAYGFEMHLSRSLGPFILSIYLPSAMWVYIFYFAGCFTWWHGSTMVIPPLNWVLAPLRPEVNMSWRQGPFWVTLWGPLSGSRPFLKCGAKTPNYAALRNDKDGAFFQEWFCENSGSWQCLGFLSLSLRISCLPGGFSHLN